MDFDDAMEAHSAWKASLLTYIGDPDGSLTHSSVVDDTACYLGEWIYGEATTAYGRDMDFAELKVSHALFHLEAARVLSKVNQGEETFAEALVGSRSAYALASDEVVRRILRMKERFPSEPPG